MVGEEARILQALLHLVQTLMLITNMEDKSGLAFIPMISREASPLKAVVLFLRPVY